MRMFSLLTITLCTLLTVSPALAKDKKTGKQMDQQAMMELWQKLAQPGEPHKLFADIAGSYTTHTKEWMEPGKPPMECLSTMGVRSQSIRSPVSTIARVSAQISSRPSGRAAQAVMKAES